MNVCSAVNLLQRAYQESISNKVGIRVNSIQITNVFLYVQDFDKHALEKFFRACGYPTPLEAWTLIPPINISHRKSAAIKVKFT